MEQLTKEQATPKKKEERLNDSTTTEGRPYGKEEPEPNNLKAKVIWYSLVLLKISLWLLFAWVLSYLHLGAPCFLLSVILWVYLEPLQRGFDWAKRRFCPFRRAEEKQKKA